MKKAIAWFPLALALGIGSVGCGAQAQPTDGAGDDTASGSAQDKLLAATGNIMMWPTGPIAWNGLNGTWPIAVWSTGTIGALAFDVAGVNNLGCTAVGLPGVVAVPITTPYLNAFTAGIGTGFAFGAPLLGTAPLLAPGIAGAGVGAVGFGAFAPGVGFAGSTFANGTFTGGLSPWLTPALTSNALMFTNLAASTAMAPLMFNLTFTATAATQTAIAAQNLAAMSFFATPIAATALTGAAIPFTSMMFPIMAPFGAIAPLGAVAPLAAPGVVGTALPGVL